MKDIAIFGAGGLGREVACLINQINQVLPQWNLIGFFDDGKVIGTYNEYGKVLGGLNELNAWENELDVVLAIGSPKVLSKYSQEITNPLISFPNIVAPNTIFLDKDNFVIGKGNIICYNSIMSCNVTIGNFNIFNGYITVGHDAIIGNCNSFMPGVRISGEVIIGNRNYFGFDSGLLQQMKVGNDIVVGANSVIMRKTKDANTYVGNPAQIVKY